MTKQYAIDMAKKLFRETNKSYFVIQEPDSNEFRIIDREERDEKGLNRYVVFSIEID